MRRDVHIGIAIVMAASLTLWGSAMLTLHALDGGQYEPVVFVLCGLVWIALAVGDHQRGGRA